jgi:hypothetical protein
VEEGLADAAAQSSQPVSPRLVLAKLKSGLLLAAPEASLRAVELAEEVEAPREQRTLAEPQAAEP